MNLSNHSRKQNSLVVLFRFIGLTGFFFTSVFSAQALAAEATSTSYQLLESAVQVSGGFSTSTSYQVQGVIPFISGALTASGTFQVGSGAVGFPVVVLSAVTGSGGPDFAQVTLTWTEARNLVNPQYEVGIGTGDGLYSYDAPQATLTVTKTNLSFAQYYFFIIRVKNGLGEIIGYSNVIQVLPRAQPAGTPMSGGGGAVSFGSDPYTYGGATSTVTTEPVSDDSFIVRYFKKLFVPKTKPKTEVSQPLPSGGEFPLAPSGGTSSSSFGEEVINGSFKPSQAPTSALNTLADVQVKVAVDLSTRFLWIVVSAILLVIGAFVLFR